MEAHAERLKRHRPQLHLLPREAVEKHPIALLGTFCGLAGGLLLALPLVIYDWAKASHAALELPMAVSAWLFGLNHFDQNGYVVWAIIVGAVILLAYWVLNGLAFAALADRVYRVRSRSGSLALGAVWSFVSFMFFWYMLLPIARDGAPFRQTAAGAASTAPNWVWILGFALSGLATGTCYRALVPASATRTETATAAESQAA